MSIWEKTKHTSKASFDAAWDWTEKTLGGPINRATNKIGSEAFWPTSLDRESDKAARILKSFCKDGFYKEQEQEKAATSEGPKQKAKVLVKIPQKVIQNACGLAIFSTMRTGLWVSGSGGSGVLIARLPDGSWSAPSGILIHTLGVGFNVGIDIYDCVVVINDPKALQAFQRLRVTLGGEISVVAGPLGVGGSVDSSINPRADSRRPCFTYMKSRGLYAGVQIDGTFILERNDENAKFYGERITALDILAGKVTNVPASTRLLQEVVKSAEGRKDANETMVDEVDGKAAPGYAEVEKHAEASQEDKEKYGYYEKSEKVAEV